MKLPIFISESGDVNVYCSIEDAENNLEAIDVLDDIYNGYDSEGIVLSFTVVERESKSLIFDRFKVKVVKIQSTNEDKSQELFELLSRFLVRIGYQPDEASNLKDLIIMMLMYGR